MNADLSGQIVLRDASKTVRLVRPIPTALAGAQDGGNAALVMDVRVVTKSIPGKFESREVFAALRVSIVYALGSTDRSWVNAAAAADDRSSIAIRRMPRGYFPPGCFDADSSQITAKYSKLTQVPG